MSFIRLGALLASAVARAGISREAQAALVIKTAQSILSGFFPDNSLYPSVRVISLSHGVLTISCNSSSQAAAIRLREQKFLSILNGRFEKEIVESLRFIS